MNFDRKESFEAIWQEAVKIDPNVRVYKQSDFFQSGYFRRFPEESSTCSKAYPFQDDYNRRGVVIPFNDNKGERQAAIVFERYSDGESQIYVSQFSAEVSGLFSADLSRMELDFLGDLLKNPDHKLTPELLSQYIKENFGDDLKYHRFLEKMVAENLADVFYAQGK